MGGARETLAVSMLSEHTIAVSSEHPSAQPPAADAARAVLRQLAATLAYRAAKVLRDAPPEFVAGAFGPATRRPVQIVLTHVGQLAMLRGMAGHPVRPESYAQAVIVPGRVGLEQACAVREFDGDASTRK